MSQIKMLKKELDEEKQLDQESDQCVAHYRRMARSYWERWHWELNQRKETIAMLHAKGRAMEPEDTAHKVPHLLQIDHT